MRRIALSAGHSNVKGQDRGAQGNGILEGEETVVFRDLVKLRLEKHGVKVSVDPNSSVTGDTVRLFKKYFSGSDVCIDIHFNSASSPNATGTEVIIPVKYSRYEHDLALALCQIISSTLGIKNRGFKTELQTPRKKLFWMTIPAETVLIETCFLSNLRDVQSYKANKEELANAVGDIIYYWLKK